MLGPWMDCRPNAFSRSQPSMASETCGCSGHVPEETLVPDSDLDLLIAPGPDTMLLTMAALKRELEENLGISVEVATEGSIRPSHRDRVMSEAKPLVAA